MNPPVRILVVDDDLDILMGTARLLEQSGYAVDRASSGEASLQAVQDHRPDLLLLDRNLPGIDGIEVCRRIEQDPAFADTFVVIVSASHAESDEQAAGLEAGADDYIGRPIENRELLVRVGSFARIQRLTSSLREQTRQLQQRNETLRQQQVASLALAEEAADGRARADKAHQALQESNELFSLFMYHSPIYIFIKAVTPTESRVLQASENYQQMVGIPGSEMVGMTMAELFPDELAERMTADDWAVVSRGEVLTLEETLRGRTYASVKFPIVRGGTTLLAGYSIDVTERKRAVEERERLQAQLIQTQKMESVGRLAGGVAHDFNNMLGVILGHAELALGQVDPTQPLHADLEEIRKAATRSADLTRQLLAFARKQTIAPRVLDLNDAVEGMLKMLGRLIGEDIRLAWVPGENVWPVMMDPSQVDQTLANLCVNARDAITGVGKMTIETGTIVLDDAYCADHAGFLPGEYVLLSVSDNGCGMDTDTLGHIFEPFFTTKAVGQGTGLGLATVYGIVKQNHGFINVYSEPNQGTTFRIYLPRCRGKTDQARTDVPAEPAAQGHETILLVEDEPAILELTTRMLERQGYRVMAASTPGEAIRLARAYPGEIHLLVTDVVMPEMNGRDLARNLLTVYPDLARLFMSGYTSNVIAHHGVLDQGVQFIQKPFSVHDLAAKVRDALGRE